MASYSFEVIPLPSLPQEIWDEIFAIHAHQVSLGSARRHGGPIRSVKAYRERLKVFFINKAIWSQRVKILHSATPFEIDLFGKGSSARSPSLAHISSHVQFIELNLLAPLHTLNWMNMNNLSDVLQAVTQQAPRLKELLVTVTCQPAATNARPNEAQRQIQISMWMKITNKILKTLRAEVRDSVKVLIVQKRGEFVRCSEQPDPRTAFYTNEELMGVVDHAEIIVNHTGLMIELKR